MTNRKIIARGLVIDEALQGVALHDRITVPSQRTMTDSGQMHVPCRFARTGEQLYTAGQLGLKDKPANEVVRVLRDEADVFATDSMETFRSAPITIGHPKDAEGKAIAVTADNAKDLQVGMLEGMPARDEDTLSGTLIITNQEAIDAIEGGTQELSAGYICDIEEVDGKLYQRNIRANHIAIVEKGRAGSGCRISDEALTVDEDLLLLVDASPEVLDVCLKLKANAALADDKLAVSQAALDSAKQDVITQKELVVDFKEQAEKAELDKVSLEVALEDAKKAAKEDVLHRSETIEHARLIADMRIEDLADKSTDEIKMLVVADNNPDKDYSSKGQPYIDAMFEILVDASKGETPMSKLLRKQESHVTVDAKPVDKAAQARANMIKRNAGLSQNK